jgi:hypothetical protein
MKKGQEDCISAKNISLLRSRFLIWTLVCLWLAYNAAMLWQLKEQTYWNASICRAAQ